MTQTNLIKDVLDKTLLNNDTVFIVPHHVPKADFDALGAAMGIAILCKKYNKDCYIIIDEEYARFDSETKKVIDYLDSNFGVVKAKTAEKLMTDNSLLVAVDVNKSVSLTEDINSLIPRFNDIVIIDHHKPDQNTIKTDYCFADHTLSCTCEEISNLLFMYDDIVISPEQANYLYAGLVLDTNHFNKNVSPNTMAIGMQLLLRGANPTTVNNMFAEDYETDKKMLKIVNNVVFPTHIYAIAADEDKKSVHNSEDIAKAADYLLKYRISASFAIGYIDEDNIYISARSKGDVDVSSIMKLFGGGGNEYSAAARVKGETIDSIRFKLEFMLNPTSYLKSGDLAFDESGVSLKLVK